MKCKWNDCGWCFAPWDLPANDNHGACEKPLACSVYLRDTIRLVAVSPFFRTYRLENGQTIHISNEAR